MRDQGARELRGYKNYSDPQKFNPKSMASPTREDVTSRTIKGEEIPTSSDLNPTQRLRDEATCTALCTLAYFCEVFDFGRQIGCMDVELSELIESGDAFENEHGEQLETLVTKALVQLESWINSPESIAQEDKQYLETAKACVLTMHNAGF